MPDYSQRSQEIEMMDDLQSSGEIIDQTLRELEVINTLLGGNHVTLNGIRQLVKDRHAPLSIVDLGCGGGDILRLVQRWCSKRKINASLIGVDANPSIVDFARNATPKDLPISYQCMDIFSEEFKKLSCDIILATLFFHHFSHESLVAFFRQLKRQTRLGFVINDIHRHWFAYHSIRILTRIFSRSEMVKSDAPLSVMRAFKKRELIDILKESGIEHYSIRWMWAFRWQVVVYSNVA